MTVKDRLRAGFKTNTLVWVLAALLVLVEFWNYQKDVQITRVCELTGPHDLTYDHPATARQELDTICGNRAAEDE